MKYVGLLSGGKDSCYNLLHCRKNGHELVAAASLRPEPGKDELDSYMYQTVGQEAIELVSGALGVPLYRRIISGDAVQQGTEYGGRKAQDAGGVKGDETEDLYELLLQVIEHHPDVKGVSVGAILSNYQRVRVEHVCRRLNLVPLCYLWQRDQGELLSEMIEGGLTAILIKVAGIGLTTKHLGKTLAEMQPTFQKLNSLYGSHICGEGGEYESFTVDCPLFKSKIILDEVETVIHSDNDFATVAYLRLKKGHLEAKESYAGEDVTISPVLEETFADLEGTLESNSIDLQESCIPGPSDLPVFELRSQKVTNWVAVSNIQRLPTGDSQAMSIADEVTECFHRLEVELHKYSLSLVHCANINIFLSSMDLFVEVNEVYSRFFGVSPPARACVAVDLPSPIRVRLDVIAYAEENSSERFALHVQGLSYWAPANIGPYSQAIAASQQVFISGQIGLLPSNLSLAPRFAQQTALSHQHVKRVTRALSDNSGNWEGAPQLVIYWLDKLVEPAPILLQTETLAQGVPSLSVVVASLPKGADVEKQVLLHTGRWQHLDEDGDIVDDTTLPTFSKTKTQCTLGGLILEQRLENADSSSVVILCIKGDISGHLTSIPRQCLKDALSARIFATSSFSASSSGYQLIKTFTIPTTQIPCRRISASDESDWDCAIVLYSPQGKA